MLIMIGFICFFLGMVVTSMYYGAKEGLWQADRQKKLLSCVATVLENDEISQSMHIKTKEEALFMLKGVIFAEKVMFDRSLVLDIAKMVS